MIAIDLWFIKIYRYGIFYAMSFVIWYYILANIAKNIYMSHSTNGKIYSIFKTIYNDIDDIIIYICIWVIAGWRLGEVLIYNPVYYIANPIKILALQNWWMSFVWWFVGVMLAIFYYQRRKKRSFDDILCLFDMIVLILPIGIILWRLGNFLNQELVGQTISYIYQKYHAYRQAGSLTSTPGEMLADAQKCLNSWFCHIYPRIDDQIRLNNNLLEWLLEWVLTGIVWVYIYIKSYRRNIRPWYITWTFMIIYSLARVIMENFRDNPPSEYIYGLLKSQLIMVVFFLYWVYLIYRSSKKI